MPFICWKIAAERHWLPQQFFNIFSTFVQHICHHVFSATCHGAKSQLWHFWKNLRIFCRREFGRLRDSMSFVWADFWSSRYRISRRSYFCTNCSVKVKIFLTFDKIFGRLRAKMSSCEADFHCYRCRISRRSVFFETYLRLIAEKGDFFFVVGGWERGGAKHRETQKIAENATQ